MTPPVRTSVARVGDVVVLTVLGAAAALAYAVRDHLSTPYDSLFEGRAARWDVPANLLRAIGRVESHFDPRALNPKTGKYENGSRDVGLMQVNTRTAASYGVTDAQLFDPFINVDTGARVLADMRSYLGDRCSMWTWPAAYNVGPDLKPVLIGEAYAAQVVSHWQLYDLGRMFQGGA